MDVHRLDGWRWIARSNPRGNSQRELYCLAIGTLFSGSLFWTTDGRVAHECIIDLRDWRQRAGIEVEDVAKRLIDYGFHAPTMSWPVPGTLMIEPTESESKEETRSFLRRDDFDSWRTNRNRERRILAHRQSHLNPRRTPPPPSSSDSWNHPYSREQAAFPAPWLKEYKFWPAVARIDNVYGDRNLFCSCPPVEYFAQDLETNPVSLEAAIGPQSVS